jgi:hypothetical protein
MCEVLDKYGADWEAEDAEQMSPVYYAISGIK